MRLRFGHLFYAVIVLGVFPGMSLAQQQAVSSAIPAKQTSCPARKPASPAEMTEIASLPAAQRPTISTTQAPAMSPSQQTGGARHEATAQSPDAKSASQETEQPSSISKNFPMVPACSDDSGLPANSQNSETQSVSEQSLTAAAARTKAEKSGRAKKMITDDDLDSSIGPLPRLKMNEAENGEDVVFAITQYKQTHTPQETEEAIRRWYDEYDEELKEAIDNNLQIQNTRNANAQNEYDLCHPPYGDYDEYRKCQWRGMAEMRGARHDQVEMMRNSEWIVRLQHSLMNIRNRIFLMGLNYPWFKVRTTNGIDRF